MSRKTATVLLSGGIDSTACVAFYTSQGFDTNALYVDYGQISDKREWRAAKAIAGHYDIPIARCRWKGSRERPAGFIVGRNGFLLIAALVEIDITPTIVAMGIHGHSGYPDCSRGFVRRMQDLFDIYSEGKVQIGVPFVRWRKADVWVFCQKNQVPLNLTYSCERGQPQPCGKCQSCLDLEVLRAGAQ